MATANIMIATPAYGGNVKIQYMESVLRTTIALRKRGITYEFCGNVNAEVVAARNYLASRMHERPQFTHLLFVDSDMAFEPAVVDKLLDTGKPLVGCIYAKKYVELAAVAHSARRQPDDSLALASAFNFVVRHSAGTTSLQITSGLCRVRGIGMGLTLIERRVFVDLLATGKIQHHDKHDFKPHGLEGPLFGFFDPAQGDDSNYISEDYSFCERWVKLCGGEIFALADEPITHIGDFSYTARYVDYLKATQKQK